MMKKQLEKKNDSLWALEALQVCPRKVFDLEEPTPCQRMAVLIAIGWFDRHFQCLLPDKAEWRKDVEAEAWCAVLENDLRCHMPSWICEWRTLFSIQLWRAFWLASKAYNALRRWARRELKEACHVRIIYWDQETDQEEEMEIVDDRTIEEWEQVETRIFWDQVWARLEPVLDRYDRIIVRGLAEGKSQQEIADAIGVTQSAIAHRLRRIRKKAKELLER